MAKEELIVGVAAKFCGGGVFAIIILSKLGGLVKVGGMICWLVADDVESKSNEGGAIIGVVEVETDDEGGAGCACLARS